jgi:predicted DNA-binding antitoxin AbrB/MazE fold protein
MALTPSLTTGVFGPIEPVVLPNGTRVHLRVEVESGAEKDRSTQFPDGSKPSPTELADFRQLMAELPIEGTNDGFSDADHNQLLYGQP